MQVCRLRNAARHTSLSMVLGTSRESSFAESRGSRQQIHNGRRADNEERRWAP